MKYLLIVVTVILVGCARGSPRTRGPESVPSTRCPLGNASYPNGERICDHGRELECRVRSNLKESGWWPTGKACRAGEPRVEAR